jgi:hypothetical protein
MSKSKFYLFIICVWLFMPFFSFTSILEKRNNKYSFYKTIFIGGVAGLTELVLGQPLQFVKNSFQQKKQKKNFTSYNELFKEVFKFLRQQPLSQYYRGICINGISMVPTTAAQISLSEFFKESVTGQGLVISGLRNGAAGVVATLIANPIELIIITQQNNKINPWKAIYNLYQKSGVIGYGRGFFPKAIRDAIFCAGFLTAYPEFTKYFQEKTNNTFLAMLLAILFVGPITAAISHPADTVSTIMQADSFADNQKKLVATVKFLHNQGDYKIFFLGLAPRTLRLGLAIIVMSLVKEWLHGMI